MGYILFMFTHCVHACSRTCVIKHSLIYGPIVFKFAVKKLQITASIMVFLLFKFTHRDAHASAWLKAFTYLWTDTLQICWAHTTSYMGYILIMFTHARVRPRA
jgi:hypothetical protein